MGLDSSRVASTAASSIYHQITFKFGVQCQLHWPGLAWAGTHLIRGSKLGHSILLSLSLPLSVAIVSVAVSVSISVALALTVSLPIPFEMIILTAAASLIAVGGGAGNEAIAGGVVNNFEASEAQMVATLPGDDHRIGLDVLYGHFGY